MKNRFKLMAALVLALTLSGGVYAYTFTTTTETIAIAAPTADIATVNTTETQPDWDSILTPVPAMTETLRPNGPGDATNITNQQPTSGEHWDKVAEVTSDGDSTYVWNSNFEYQYDLYNIPEHILGEGDINYVKVYTVCRSTVAGTATNRAVIKTGGEVYLGAVQGTTTSYATYSHQWNANPNTGMAWTWSEIDTLQIGVGLQRPKPSQNTLCTQVYVEVNYSGGIPLRGNVPTGNLFTVTPATGYTADLAVKVYLVNTGNLTKAYRYLDMKLYLEGSVEAGQTPNYQVLTLDNGVATFNLENGGGISRILSVTGGGYGLNSKNPLEWETGWTVTPHLYCEATQR